MVDSTRKIFHCWCQSSNESLYSSRSNLGGDPYGLNAFVGMAVLSVEASFLLRSASEMTDMVSLQKQAFLFNFMAHTKRNHVEEF